MRQSKTLYALLLYPKTIDQLDDISINVLHPKFKNNNKTMSPYYKINDKSTMDNRKAILYEIFASI